MLGNFHPSKIEDEIYSIMDDYALGSATYESGCADAIADYLGNHLHIEYQLGCSAWPNNEGGVCAVAFVENGFPHLIIFDYQYTTEG